MTIVEDMRSVNMRVAITGTLAAMLCVLPAGSASRAHAPDPAAGHGFTPTTSRAASAWTPLTPSPLARTEVSAAAVGRSIYVVGGYGTGGAPSSQVERYDVDTDSWSLVAPMPRPLNHTAAVAYAGDLYLVGGYTGLPFSLGIGTGGIADSTDSFLRYDPQSDTWSEQPPAPTKRAATAAAVIGDRLYVAGGADSFQPLTDFEIYDFGTGTWSTGPELPLATEHTAGAAAGGDYYVVGGRPAYGQPNNEFVQRYDPETGGWQRVADLLRARGGLGAVGVCGGVVAFGGEDPRSGPPGVIPETERYRPSADTWESLPEMPTPRHGLGAAAVGDRVYALEGGPITFGAVSNVAEALDLDCGGPTAGASGDSKAKTTLGVKPRRAPAGKLVRFRFTIRSAAPECRAGVLVRFAGKAKRTTPSGGRVIAKRVRRPGRRWARIAPPGCEPARARINILPG